MIWNFFHKSFYWKAESLCMEMGKTNPLK